MPEYRLLITDLTEYGDLRCVAGWDIDRERMVRPEPRPAAFWPSVQTGRGQAFLPGNIVRLTARKPNPATSYPHFSEDRVVEGRVVIERTLQPHQFRARLGEIGLSAEDVFNNNVILTGSGAYVATGTRCPSLYGIQVGAEAIQFREQSFEGKTKLRCLLSIADRRLNLSVSAVNLRQLWRSQGLDALPALISSSAYIHVRVGLARGFASYPDRCYMQINGMYGL